MYRGCCLEQSMVMALCRLDVVAVDSASRDDEAVRVVPFVEVCIDLHSPITKFPLYIPTVIVPE